MEHGGNVFHRHLCDHPSLYTYPFESQLGTKFSHNLLSPIYPYRYFWPEFPESTTPEKAYDLMWDEELKCLLRARDRSKFKDCGLIMDEKERISDFVRYCYGKPLIRKTFIEAYFISTFKSWTNYNKSGGERFYVGYNPGMTANTDLILKDFPDSNIIHIIRNPFSAYSDYLKRPYPNQSLEEYCSAYNVIHQLAYNYSRKYPNNFHILKIEDFLANKRASLTPILDKISIPWSDTLLYPSFNGKKLDSCKPWGTIVTPTTDVNLATAKELNQKQINGIGFECGLMLKTFYPNLSF